MMFCLVLGVAGCSTPEVILGTMHPVDGLTKGFPRVAQDEVEVLIDQTGKRGVLKNSAGYFLIHESDLRAMLKALDVK